MSSIDDLQDADTGILSGPTEGVLSGIPVEESSGPPPFPVEGWERYEFVSFLGEGGMGRVFKAFDPRLKRHVALKFLRVDDPGLAARLLQEAQRQARVDHPNVCSVFDAGEVNGKPFVALPFLAGRPLNEAAKEMSLPQKVRVMRDAAEGLHAAHRLGLIHRDVKPANIFVETREDGTPHPYIMDFGLAREAQSEGMTASGSIVGTPWYMSPEQARGENRKLDRRSDVFSLGSTLYELFAGKPPFRGSGPLDTLVEIIQREPKLIREEVPGFPLDLDIIVQKCLQKEPRNRYESARALAQDLQRFLEGEPILARPPSLTQRLGRAARKNLPLTASLSLLVLIVLLGTAWGIRSTWVARQRALMAQNLGQEIKELEVLMRFASHMLPLHDVRSERAIVRGRLEELARRLSAAGSTLPGPGDYALGRGYLTLGEIETAHRHLAKAWSAGYRTPEAAYSLGLSLALLYDKEIRNLSSVRTKQEREARRKHLDESLRRPALLHLRESQAVVLDSPDYVAAMVAYHERDHARAVLLARKAADAVPWNYEARALEGAALRQQADSRRDRGDEAGATADYALAEAAFLRSIEVGRSYPVAYQGLCSLYSELMEFDWRRRTKPVERYAMAETWCLKAATADPDDPLTQLRLSDIYWRWAESLVPEGADPRPWLDKSIAAAEKSIPSGFDLAYAYDNLGIAYQQKGDWEEGQGLDPAASYGKAVEYFGVCMTKFPGLFSSYCNSALAKSSLARWMNRRGQDPRSVLEEARESLRAGKEVSDHDCLLCEILGIELQAVRFAFLSRSDGSGALSRFETALGELRRRNPGVFQNEALAARAYSTAAGIEIVAGRDPAPAFARGREAIANARHINASEPSLDLFEGETAFLEAASGRSPKRSLAVARQKARRAMTSMPRSVEPFLLAALVEARSADGRGSSERGLEFVRLALERDANSGEAWLLKGLFAGRLGSGDRPEAERKAREIDTRLFQTYGVLAGMVPAR